MATRIHECREWDAKRCRKRGGDDEVSVGSIRIIDRNLSVDIQFHHFD